MLRVAFLLTIVSSWAAWGAESADEKIWGVLELTARPGACAQIKDTLGDTYYVVKSDDAEKLVKPFVGKNIRVVIQGRAELRETEGGLFLALKSVEQAATKRGSETPQALPKP